MHRAPPRLLIFKDHRFETGAVSNLNDRFEQGRKIN